MQRKRKSLLHAFAWALCAVAAAMSAAQFLVVSGLTFARFRALEREDLKARLDGAESALGREAKSLAFFTSSYAAWTPSYEYVLRPDAGFIKRNFGGTWATNYDIDFAMIVAADGRRLWSSAGSYSFEPMTVPPLEAPRFDPSDPYVFPAGAHPAPTDARTGYAMSDRGLLLYCAHPVTDDSYLAPPRGILVFGRLVDQAFLDGVTSGRGVKLGILPAEAGDLGLAAAGWPIVSEDGAEIKARVPLGDTAGKEVAALGLSMQRTFYRAGVEFARVTSLFLVLSSLASLAVVLVLARKMVLRPVANLAAYVEAHAEGRETERLAESARLDEIGLLAARVGDLIEKTERQKAELIELARKDQLTGLANRRQFEEHAARELRRVGRARWGESHRGLVAVAILDIDYFKLYNDCYGHLAGDECLRKVASAAASCLCRSEDLLCRFGGEEFLAFMPDTDLEGAAHVAECMRSRVEALGEAHADSPLGFVSISIGVSAGEVGEGFSLPPLVKKADEALYAAKGEGRNRVGLAGPESA